MSATPSWSAEFAGRPSDTYSNTKSVRPSVIRRRMLLFIWFSPMGRPNVALQPRRRDVDRNDNACAVGCERLLGSRSLAISAEALPNRVDLLEMVDVMPGEVHRDVSDGLDATLSMHSEHVPFLGAERTEEGEIRFTQDTKEFQRRAHVPHLVPSRTRPHVLIERLNSCPRRRQDHSQAIPAHELIVGQMSDHFLNGPLSRPWSMRKLFCRQTRHE